MKLSDLTHGLPVRTLGNAEVGITGVTDDSRRVKPGDLFIARAGHTTDGRRFIDDALRRGAAAVLTDREAGLAGAAVVSAGDVAGVGTELARRFHGDPAAKLKLIGVTGTNGKTTTTYMVRHLLGAAGVRCGVIGTVEIDTGIKPRPSELTTPGAIELIGLLGAGAGSGDEDQEDERQANGTKHGGSRRGAE